MTTYTKKIELSNLCLEADNALNAGDYNTAIMKYLEVLNHDEDPNVLHNLGTIYQRNFMYFTAIHFHKRAVKIKPDHFQSLGHLSNCFLDLGQPEKAFKIKQRVMELHTPGTKAAMQAHSELIFFHVALNTFDDYTREMKEFQKQHLKWLYKPTPKPKPHTAPRVRLGYISADFCKHTVMNLLHPLFNNYDKERYELFLYSGREDEDELTQHLRDTTNFRKIFNVSDKNALRAIKRDKLDLLIDLSGYSGGHRQSLLIRKPAPRIATGLGFITPTANPAIDYVIMDDATAQDFSFEGLETRAPIITNMFYKPEPELPLKTPTRSEVVFGSGNSLFKYNREVFAVWAEILRLVPDSILYLKAKSLGEADAIKSIKDRFERLDINPDRIKCSGKAKRAEFMQFYHDVDICLDPFPYQGGVTTSEALYMGCPVITMNNRGVNTSTSILQSAGLHEYLAANTEEYIQKAVQMARIMAMIPGQKRMAIREHMRQTIMESRIFNADMFARDLEKSYEWILRDGGT